MNDKDKAAIDHIASVSKNPHAAMIVKWLITGLEVEIKQEFGDSFSLVNNPAWSENREYRLIEPKPAKPAYRVYGGENGTNTVDRLPNGSLSHGIPDGAEWISDWIEYDPPKKWPTPLVERIAAIDLDAAQWIVEHWDDLLDERYSEGVTVGRESGRLCSMFTWSSSTQGKDYWYAISKQLGE